jgi:murein DD-endopeptidase MepM/ murein hydrolase activator NlpD
MLGVLILLLSTAPAWSSAAAAGEPGGPVWVWPLAGPRAVSRPFDPPSTRYGPGHRGADLPGASGQVVRAAGAGRVSYAGLLAGRGVVVVVHGALRTTYEPVTASVRPGQQVTAGQPIGVLVAGHAGCAGTCLHWGLLRGSVYLDPVQLVSRGPSRLLPLTGPVPAPLPAPLPQERGRPLAAALASPAADAPAPRPAAQPSFALRAADVGWGALALMALILGLALLLRPRRPPAGPAAPPYAVAVSQPPGLVDLATERSRRRAGVA